MERLDTITAAALLQRLGHADRENGAASASFPGAVIFADISGYTTLAESLCAQGHDGIEQLGRILDGAFQASMRAVSDTGGEVACFAGDALIAYWAASDRRLDDAVRLARTCAARLHEAAESTSLMPSPPALHVGLSAGDIWAARLGTPGRWHLLLAGGAVRTACAAAGRAHAGETIESLPAAEWAGARDESLPIPTTAASAPARSGLAEQVPRRVQEYIERGYASWIPQRRTICALFVRIDGLDDSAPDALQHHQAAAAALLTALRPYTGAPGSLLRDDKGLVFTVCLGMPQDAHADDALRAVRAGLAIESALSRIGLSGAIGVASGPAVCMPLGGPPIRHYWSVGRCMHIAGRLMEAAGRGILCTEEVADQVRRAVSLSPERPLSLKGLRAALRPVRVREAAGLDEHPEQIHGREDEQAAIERCLEAFDGGRGTILWIEGDAGLGKTALVHDLERRAARHGIESLAGGAGSLEIGAAYAAWKPVFAALLTRADGTASSRLTRDDLPAALQHPQLAPLVNAVVPGAFPETSLVRSLTGQARADATTRVLSDVLGLCASSRFLLVLEDCHWMDSASWRLALRVAQEYPQALLVLTSRPGADIQELASLRRLEHFVAMTLRPLRASAIESIVESVLGDRMASEATIDDIVHRSVGSPLFAREYALLMTTRLLPRADAQAAPSLPSIAADGPPVTVQSLIASRLDALSPVEDVTLKTASVIGDTFGASLLGEVHPGRPGDPPLDATLRRLAALQLIVVQGMERYAFQHVTILEVTYAQLTGEQRRDLHRAVAEAIERQQAADLGPHAAALAHHWFHAGVAAPALRYGEDAAVQALRAGAFEEAERLLSNCVQLAAAGGANVAVSARVRWHRQLADARHGLGRLEARSAAAHQALRLAGLVRPHRSVALLGQAVLRLGGMAIRRVRPPRHPPADAAGLMDVARAYRHSAEVCYFNNDMIGMLCDSLSAVSYASRLEPSAVLAGAATELGGIATVAASRRLGEWILRRAIAMAEAADDHAAQAYAHLINCLYYVGTGDWDSAERSSRRCQELCEPMDDRVNWTNAQTVRFWMCHYRSHDTAAYDAARGLRDRASETGNRQHQAWALRCLAVCALRRNDPAEALAHVQAALERLGETAALNERIPTLGLLAVSQLRTGQTWAARATAKDALAQAARVTRPIGHGTLEGYSGLLTVALDAWRDEGTREWREASRAFLRLLHRYARNFPIGGPRYELHAGAYQHLAGSTTAARRCYARGAATAERLGMPWESARLREALTASQ